MEPCPKWRYGCNCSRCLIAYYVRHAHTHTYGANYPTRVALAQRQNHKDQ